MDQGSFFDLVDVAHCQIRLVDEGWLLSISSGRPTRGGARLWARTDYGPLSWDELESILVPAIASGLGFAST